MDPPELDSQPTQATQNALDPRRVGKQNSGFSDEDISDIICLLYPNSPNARREVQRLAAEGSHHVVGRSEADNLDLDYSVEDDADRFGFFPSGESQHTIALRLSAAVKDPLQGFTFGRNRTRCDIPLLNDALRRLSNIHFRIHVNAYGVLMLEDTSTNGTIVDEKLLKSKSKHKRDIMRTLSSGSTVCVLMHDHLDDFKFIVRLPRREGENEAAYRRNMAAYLKRLQVLADRQEQTIGPGPSGHVDIFGPDATRQRTPRPGGLQFHLPDETTEDEDVQQLPKDWTGSDKYNRIGQIGKGAFATVYKVTCKFTGKPYAAKELDKRRFMKNGVLDQKVENEMNIMQKVHHPNIVRYIEHFDWDNRLFIMIMEFVPGGDLGLLINKRGPLPEPTVKVMADQLADALGYLHQNNITHRDVKPDNILVQTHQPFYVKLTDFGLSKMVDNDQTFLRTFCGTLLYCAPEVYSEYADYDEDGRRNPRSRQRRTNAGKRYDHAVDIWSLGGVLFFALTGSPPFPVKTGISYSELLHQIMTRPLDVDPLRRANISADGIDFLGRMLQRRPETRATVQNLEDHPWLGSGDGSMRRSGRSRSDDEVSDAALEVGASQLSLEENGPRLQMAQSDDEILEVDEINDENRRMDYYDSGRENYTFGHVAEAQVAPPLFGEVNVSAIGSSGVIPEDRLNLPVSKSSLGETEILGSEIGDSYGSEELSTPRQQRSQPRSSGGAPPLSADQSHSVEQLNNMTFDVASQSLGGAESIMGNLNMKSLAASRLLGMSMGEFNTSKRKPAYDTSDEMEGGAAPAGKPTTKRLKSDNPMTEDPSDSDGEDCVLYATIPPIAKLHSSRQIDTPVHKATYWAANDRKTWHLRYPEMTQLQHDAFKAGAEARGEEFASGRSMLWALAMKHFPPAENLSLSASPDATGGAAALESGGPSTDDGKNLAKSGAAPTPTPATLPPMSSPANMPAEGGGGIVVPVTMDPPDNKRVAATLESAPDSVVQDIRIAVTDAVTSWGRAGRAAGNTHVFEPSTQVMVPKHAFKIILWREGYDPSKAGPLRDSIAVSGSEEDAFYFYISTKATYGIEINNTPLPSHEPKNPTGPARNWIRLHDGDTVTFWYSRDQPRKQASLLFRCGWGGSARRRTPIPSAPSQAAAAAAATISPPPSPTALVPEATGRKLDDAVQRANRRSERDVRSLEADADYDLRQAHIERERERSRRFEARRAEACLILSLRGSRRASPASVAGSAVSGGNGGGGNVAAGGGGGAGRTVPTFRHGSPAGAAGANGGGNVVATLQVMNEEG